MKGTGSYPHDWQTIAKTVKEEADWRCIRCGHANDSTNGHTLTVHHGNGDKSDCRWWNLLALCQRCHLHIQGTVHYGRPWIFGHAEWFKPYVAGYYAWHYLGLDLCREQVEERLEELLALEAQAILGTDPIPL